MIRQNASVLMVLVTAGAAMHLCDARLLAAAPVADPIRPNVLLILSDDQRGDSIGALGGTYAQTPALDALARAGTVFTQAVSPNPLCVPARAEILTGCSTLHGGRIDVRLRASHLPALWPETMHAAGYRTWYVGKWHNEGRPRQRGYDETRALYVGGGKEPMTHPVDHAGREVTGYRGWVLQDDDGRKHPEFGVGLTPEISRHFGDAAVEMIRRRAEQPFFGHVNFTAPHDPLLLPPAYATAFPPDRMPSPGNFLPRHPFDHGNIEGRDELLWPWPRTPDMVRRELAAYYAVVAHMDEQIGRILAALRETGQAERTIVIFASDQGLAVGSHGLRGKQNMYEHTVRTPLVMCGPGIPKGARVTAQCYLRDLYPTVCDVAGIDVPKQVEGRSLAPVIRGERKEIYPHVFCYFGEVQRMIRTDRWKLIHYPKIDRQQLFDVENDPEERKDLIAEPRLAKTLSSLRGQLDKEVAAH